MTTRLEQIQNKIRLSKIIDMNYIFWETTIDNKTIEKLRSEGYSVEQGHLNQYYIIKW